MDTSETYIKMCEKAVKIQELWKPVEGDWVHWPAGGGSYSICECNCKGGILEYTKGHIWLPRQDQLHPMSDLTWMDFDRKCADVQEQFGWLTKEMAGIMVVMKEKYQKEWSGSEWVNLS